MMSMLPAIPVLLLGVFFVWFLWPTVADPLGRAIGRVRGTDDRDRLAEHLFDAWSQRRDLARNLRG